MNIKPMLEIFKKNKTDKTPIWLMRQAGRYMEEYRKTRKSAGSFLDLCYNPELAAEVTLQPIRKFGFDAAIIFSDILVIPDAMGVKVNFVEGEGPRLEKIIDLQSINRLKVDIEEKLNPVYLAIENVKKSLSNNTSLIGFAGSPWTVATYMIEGGSSKDFFNVKKMAYLNEKNFTVLIDKLVLTISNHLINQIKSGAEIVMLFDSWAGVLNHDNFFKWVIEPTRKIVENVKKAYPDVPVIGFPKNANILYEDFLAHTKVDGVSLDSNLSYKYIKNNIKGRAVIQGNLDPIYLLADRDILKSKIYETLDNLSGDDYIFNLGHGVVKETPEDNVRFLIDTVRNYNK
jgi:uroporphyrinogen decarboxylase